MNAYPRELRYWPFGMDHKTIAHIPNNGKKIHILHIESKSGIEEELKNTTTKIVFLGNNRTDFISAQIISGPYKGELLFLKVKN